MFCRLAQKKHFIWLALSIFVNSFVAITDVRGAGGLPRYHVSHWTAEDGLPQNRVTALAQTPDGYVWVGTWTGLARFDGERFTVFNEVNTPAMASQAINGLAVDNE